MSTGKVVTVAASVAVERLGLGNPAIQAAVKPNHQTRAPKVLYADRGHQQ